MPWWRNLMHAFRIPGGRTRSVFLVSAGAIAGQAVVIGSMPLITRLYTPNSFGLYAVFASSVGIFSTVIALHYELAIPLPKSDAIGRKVATTALLASTVLSCSVGILLWMFDDQFFEMVQAPQLSQYGWVFPCVLALNGLALVSRTWVVRKKAFASLALSNVLQGVGQPVPQVIAGAFGGGVFGLMLGQITGPLAAILVTARWLPKRLLHARGRRALMQLRVISKRYKKFALITTWSSLINSFSIHLPVLVLSFYFGPTVAAFFALGYRVMQLPVRFIGQAVSQVFFSMAAEAHRQGALIGVTDRIFRAMFSFAFPTFMIGGYIAPELAEVGFGIDWVETGEYAQLLMPWMLFSFISTTLSVLVSVLHKQGQELVFQLAYLLCIMISLVIGGYFGSVPAIASLGLLGGMFLMVKTIWLLALAGVSIRRSFQFAFFEVIYLAPAMAILYLIKQAMDSHMVTIAVGLGIIGFTQFVNLHVRKTYAR